MKKLALAASVAAVLSAPVQADMLFGLYIGGQVWDTEPTGTFGQGSQQADFGLDSKQQGSYFVAVEHPIPLIPNVKVASTSLATEGVSELTLDLWGKSYTADTVSTDFDVSYMDYTLYYELFDNGLFSFDFGLTARDFTGDISVNSKNTGNNSGVAASGFLPMAYVHTNIGIPATGFNLYGTANLLSIGDHSLYDYEAGISYELIDNLAIDINLTVGYRAMSLQLDDLDELTSDLEFKGVYAGAVVHF